MYLVYFIGLSIMYALSWKIQANTAEELGFHVASMFYVDGELITVGTRTGKSYLNSHPAIMATFQSHFLYGIELYYHYCSLFCFSYAGDFSSKLPSKSTEDAAGKRECRDQKSSEKELLSHDSTPEKSPAVTMLQTNLRQDLKVQSWQAVNLQFY